MRYLHQILYCTIFISLVLWAESLQAQAIAFSQPQRLPVKITDYEIIGKIDGEVLLHKWGDRYNAIEAFEADGKHLVSKWNKEFDFGHKQISVIKVFALKSSLLFFYTYKEKRVTFVYAIETTPDVKPLKEAVLLNTVTAKFNNYGYKIDVDQSPNRQYYNVLLAEFDFNGVSDLRCHVVDRNLKTIYKPTFIQAEKQVIKQTILGNDGSVYVGSTEVRRTLSHNMPRLENLYLYYYQKGDSVATVVSVPKQKYLLNDVRFELDPINDKMLIVGFYAEKSANVTDGYYFANIDLEQRTVTKPIFQPFSDAFLPKLKASMGIRAKGNIQNLVIKKIFVRKDGGALILGEAFHVSHQRTGFNVLDPLTVTYEDATNFYHEDIVALSIHPDGQIFWEKVLLKKQYSEGDDGYFSSFGIVNSRSKLNLLFNESISNRSSLNTYSLTSTGEYEVSSLVNMRGFDFMIAPRYAKQLTAKEIVLPGFNNKNEFLLTMIRF